MLFNSKTMKCFGTKRHNESSYHYLNNSAREEANKIRSTLEQWFESYPEEEKQEFITRFTSNNDTSFIAAFFELYLFTLYKKQNFNVIIHPKTNTDKGSPDFLISKYGFQDFYLEAVLSNELSERERKVEKNDWFVIEKINEIKLSDWYLNVDFSGILSNLPSEKVIKNPIVKWVKTLDVNLELEKYKQYGIGQLPELKYEIDGFYISVSAFPKEKEYRILAVPSVAGLSGRGMWLSTNYTIRDSLKKKGKKYGKLDKPLVVALNYIGMHCDESDILEAFFGKKEFSITRDGKQSGSRRKKDGFWFGPLGPVYKRVSSVLLVSELSPWNMADKEIIGYHNPWADRSLIGQIGGIRQMVPEQNEYRELKITNSIEILSIPTF